MTTKKQTNGARPVVVTTSHKGVFFGYVTGATAGADMVRLERARMCVYWTSAIRGVLGLAATGPDRGCKIGPAVPAIELRGVTSVVDVTPEAAKAWEYAPWA